MTASVLCVAQLANSFAPVLMTNAEATGRSSRIIGLNSGLGVHGTHAYAVSSASKVSLFRIAVSVVYLGYEKGLWIFEMAPGVVVTAMTKYMPVHDFRGERDWTTLSQITELALALATGSLDAIAGRYVRAGADTEESLIAEAAAGLEESTRRLVLG